VPIPTLVDKHSGEAKTSADFIRFVAALIAEKRTDDVHPTSVWWKMSANQLINHKVYFYF